MTSVSTHAHFFLICLLSLVVLGACGVSKTPVQGGRGVSLPELERPKKEVQDKDTLTLKSEELKLTAATHEWKPNNLAREQGAEKYLRLQKRFSSPIQFNGWIALDRVENRNSSCAQEDAKAPLFILEDDHGGEVLMQVGEKIAVHLEKLYVVRVEYFNDSLCQGVDIQFGVLYGTNE